MFDQSQAEAVLARFADVVDDLLALSVPSAPDGFVLDALRPVQVQVNRRAAVDAALVGEADARRIAFEAGCANTATLLVQLLRIDPGQARARVAAAAELGPRRSLTGEPLGPIYPTVATALGDGSITARHAQIVTRTVEALPAAVAAEHDRAVETLLVDQARLHPPRTLATIARRVTDTLDPDGILSDEADRQRRRHLDVCQRPDGSASVRGELDAICTEALLTVLDPLATPTPAENGERDPRSAGQRRHDGLRDGLLAAIRSRGLPDRGGITTTILLTTSTDQLHSGSGLARSGHGALIPTRTINRDLLGDAQVMPITLRTGGNGNSAGLSSHSAGVTHPGVAHPGVAHPGVAHPGGTRVESYGPARRFFTTSQRLAMAARDGGCSFPGCTTPASWCQAHHVVAWTDGGATILDNGTLLCGFHHRHFEQLGWHCQVNDGTPHWIPPPWIDPRQQPRRNTAHCPTAGLATGAASATDSHCRPQTRAPNQRMAET